MDIIRFRYQNLFSSIFCARLNEEGDKIEAQSKVVETKTECSTLLNMGDLDLRQFGSFIQNNCVAFSVFLWLL